jgi:hypothetical protein
MVPADKGPLPPSTALQVSYDRLKRRVEAGETRLAETSVGGQPDLAGAVRVEKGRHRNDQYLGVERERPVLCVILIVRNAFAVGRRAASADLPKTGYSRTARNVGAGRARISYKFILSDRAWSNDAHVPSEDVEELRQLIQARFAEDGAYRRDARIVAQLAGCGPFGSSGRIRFEEVLQTLRRVGHHRAKFQAAKRLAVEAHAPMTKQRGSG